ncbi:MAG: FG-GAP-like repeat-containing protein [Bacteroidota bacterium]
MFLLFVFLITGKTSTAQSFTKVTTSPVSTTIGDSRSVNWIDVNNDGLIDLMITNGPAGGQDNFLYINNGGGNFTAVTGDPIVSDFAPSDGATWADMDNDGDIDAFVVNWHGVNNLLYINSGNDTFIQEFSGSPVNDLGYSETASWGDYDNDGLVDLYVTNSDSILRNYLYHNNGGGAFTKITTGTMVTDQYKSRCVNWTDIDMDNDPDLFITNENNQQENIYRNDGAGIFAKVTAGAIVNNSGNTMSSSWADIDNDGDLDVFLSNDGATNALFRNDGNFNFSKLVNDTVSKTPGHSFSSAWSDIDNDGDVDLFVTNSFGASLYNNFLYTNDGNGNFTRISGNAIVSDFDWTYGCAFGDYDNDGFEDLAAATCRFNGVDRSDLLYHNDGNNNNWITFHLVGMQSNKSAIGAIVRIKSVINGNVVWQMREISAQSSYCGQNDLRVHFGIGNATAVDSVIVQWPSDSVEYFTGITVNQFLNIIEGQGITGMNEIKTIDGITLYPNPTSGIVKLRNKQLFSRGDEIKITDKEGRLCYSMKVTSEEKEITINTIKQVDIGDMYLLHIYTSGKNHTFKMIRY